MGVQPILPVKVSVSIDTMLNVDSDFDRHGDGDFTCKQILTLHTKGTIGLYWTLVSQQTLHTDAKCKERLKYITLYVVMGDMCVAISVKLTYSPE